MFTRLGFFLWTEMAVIFFIKSTQPRLPPLSGRTSAVENVWVGWAGSSHAGCGWRQVKLSDEWDIVTFVAGFGVKPVSFFNNVLNDFTNYLPHLWRGASMREFPVSFMICRERRKFLIRSLRIFCSLLLRHFAIIHEFGQLLTQLFHCRGVIAFIRIVTNGTMGFRGVVQ